MARYYCELAFRFGLILEGSLRSTDYLGQRFRKFRTRQSGM